MIHLKAKEGDQLLVGDDAVIAFKSSVRITVTAPLEVVVKLVDVDGHLRQKYDKHASERTHDE